MVKGIDEYGLTIYENVDGRLRAYNPDTGETTSYPRILVEKAIGKKLSKDQDIHHIDGNPLNNDLSNLQILSHAEHARLHGQKYFDMYVVCPNCLEEFLWSAKSQSKFHSNRNRKDNIHLIHKPFCSRRCAGQYSRREQLKRQQESQPFI